MASPRDFVALSQTTPNCYRMNLSGGKIEIMPVHHETGRKELILGSQIHAWCHNNPLVGEYGGATTGWTLPTEVVEMRCADASVVLMTRWNNLTNDEKAEAYPAVAPNFVIELRSVNDTAERVHEKMLMWMNAGVEEGFSLDPFDQKARIYRTLSRNRVTWTEYQNPPNLRSNVLNGFVLNLQGII
ncbi:hypothetical protein RhiirA5_500784 [Rhizophagus irregularis]|uniref:Restriction endonuclease type II-like protein n=2 Tax=Rhizophagus irregularis TaxID=588596 RepID=U9TFK9_RHIID|nr:restriction endonuclease type II-like protein [Rhizophagus irregularis DAOM 181602=DAOM 197198]PKC07264.1 hypothetical protein RhiirA5_500784 [Rhizophagus irregularis]PKC65913.1 hypothetical protein RhiirA1_535992 [Rhizophagus irregularis]PKY25673.1 hypothetical protein RhiirB3_472633 [Rhizophagus irregularis]POG60927.1 restriction endonuclease type II-like protein [Rhizophagus irregularis DAOM 181602=DAOM 197198]UZO10783.1 hypothetical protein OCT59_002361 [Rhizophagus irregularis]|eukprot:XP_025167793.1 restriction endonuclease type II-like protein [Rhizophagus irregularis DAOM 181602=DAOM 197198]